MAPVSIFCEHGWFVQAGSFEEAMATAVDLYADTQTEGDVDQAEALVREDYELGIILIYGPGGDYVIH